MKRLISLAIFLLVAGIIISGVAIYFLKFDSSVLSTVEIYTNTSYVENSFTNIEIEGIDSKVTLIPWEDEECKIVLTEAENITHTIDVSNGTLRIIKRDKRKWNQHIGIFVEEMTIDVYLPKNEYEKLRIDNSSGGVVISEGFTFSEINAESSSGSVKCYASAQVISIRASSGSVNLEGVSASDIKLNTSSGSIKLSNIDCGDMDVSASSGSVKLSSVNCDNISAETSSGSVTVSDVIASDKMALRTGSGSVKLDDSDAQDINIRTGSGSVSGTLLTEKIFVTETGSGSVKVPQSFEGGKCYIKTGSGSIKISISSDK